MRLEISGHPIEMTQQSDYYYGELPMSKGTPLTFCTHDNKEFMISWTPADRTAGRFVQKASLEEVPAVAEAILREIRGINSSIPVWPEQK